MLTGDALGRAMLERYEKQMVAHLRATLPDETANISGDDLERLVQQGIERAESHGVTDRVDVERFLEFLGRYGAEFGQNPDTAWAAKILNDCEIRGDDKVNRLEDYELFELQPAKHG